MHRRYLYILGIYLSTSFALWAGEIDSYSIRREQRSFESIKTNNSYFMKDNVKSHPGIKRREKSFFPPLEDCDLYLILPRSEKAQLTVDMGDDSAKLHLPVSGNRQVLTLRIPKGKTVRSITMPVTQKFSLEPYDFQNRDTEIFISLDKPEEYILTVPALDTDGKELRIVLENRDSLRIQNKEGDNFRLESFEGQRSFHFPFPGDSDASLILSSPTGPEYLSFQAVDEPAFPTPITRGGAQILNRSLSTWRNKDFEIYSWSSFPEILILDCLDYEVQNRFFRRLAFFVEKKGYKGTLLSNAELKGKHAWNAHDYRPYDLAEFYNLIQERNFSIYPEEALLRNILINRGILIQNEDGSLVPGEGAVLSISRESSDTLRYRFFVHEAAHGIYFISLEYREFVRSLWESLHNDDRAMWRFFLGWYGYDPNEEDLMINEFQAYLLQQTTHDAPGYFGPRMSSLIGKYPVERDILSRGTGAGSAGFQVWAEVLEDWISAKWGLKAGNFFPLHKELP